MNGGAGHHTRPAVLAMHYRQASQWVGSVLRLAAQPPGRRARSYVGVFALKSARVATVGDRVDVAFDGLRMGIFEGSVHFRFFPGSR